jgi:hypothetical protein
LCWVKVGDFRRSTHFPRPVPFSNLQGYPKAKGSLPLAAMEENEGGVIGDVRISALKRDCVTGRNSLLACFPKISPECFEVGVRRRATITFKPLPDMRKSIIPVDESDLQGLRWNHTS